MAFVKKFDDFKLFQPTDEEAAAAERTLPRLFEINRNFSAWAANFCPANGSSALRDFMQKK
jgi:hypothetical protein